MKACKQKPLACNHPKELELLEDESASTTLEWALLLGAIALPTGLIILKGLDLLVMKYAIIVRLTNCPFP